MKALPTLLRPIFALSYLPVPLVAILICLGCNEKSPKAKSGGVDLLFSVYFQASKGLENSRTYHRSSISFLPEGLFEIAPLELGSTDKMAYYLIKDSLYFRLAEGTKFPQVLGKGNAVMEKPIGAPFSNSDLPLYHQRKDLSDTLLFKKRYHRFEITTPQQYSRYYVLSGDSLLPYSLYPQIEKDYKGRLERIDYYDLKADVFYSLQWVRRQTLSPEAASYLNRGVFLSETKRTP